MACLIVFVAMTIGMIQSITSRFDDEVERNREYRRQGRAAMKRVESIDAHVHELSAMWKEQEDR